MFSENIEMLHWCEISRLFKRQSHKMVKHTQTIRWQH